MADDLEARAAQRPAEREALARDLHGVGVPRDPGEVDVVVVADECPSRTGPSSVPPVTNTSSPNSPSTTARTWSAWSRSRTTIDSSWSSSTRPARSHLFTTEVAAVLVGEHHPAGIAGERDLVASPHVVVGDPAQRDLGAAAQGREDRGGPRAPRDGRRRRCSADSRRNDHTRRPSSRTSTAPSVCPGGTRKRIASRSASTGRTATATSRHPSHPCQAPYGQPRSPCVYPHVLLTATPAGDAVLADTAGSPTLREQDGARRDRWGADLRRGSRRDGRADGDDDDLRGRRAARAPARAARAVHRPVHRDPRRDVRRGPLRPRRAAPSPRAGRRVRAGQHEHLLRPLPRLLLAALDHGALRPLRGPDQRRRARDAARLGHQRRAPHRSRSTTPAPRTSGSRPASTASSTAAGCGSRSSPTTPSCSLHDARWTVEAPAVRRRHTSSSSAPTTAPTTAPPPSAALADDREVLGVVDEVRRRRPGHRPRRVPRPPSTRCAS